MIYPNIIDKDAIIGITATSMGLTNDFDFKRLKLAKENITKLGYKTIETNNVFTNSKFVSSNGETRAKEFIELLQNDDVKVIAHLRGGEFLFEMLPFLDDDIIKNNPKWLFGYSDSSLLNFYITTKFQIATINSSNILQFSMDKLHLSLVNIFKCINDYKIIQNSFSMYESCRDNNCLNYILDKKVKYQSLYHKEVTIKGRLIGGCLEAISEIIGTKYDNVSNFCNFFSKGVIWYLDIYNLNPLELYQKLWTIKINNWFTNTNGILIGRTKSLKEIEDFTYGDALHKVFDDMNIPVIYDVDIGHIMPQFSIINGSFGTFIYKNNKGILIQEKIK